MQEILTKYELNSDMQFYCMIIDCLKNGKNKSALSKFKELPKNNKLELIESIKSFWNTGLTQKQINLITNNL